jgi:2-keto-4-pentenoate hydratase/2-oxohepta-3-ene-1,7-dioic acid hydratase in catechol pathway
MRLVRYRHHDFERTGLLLDGGVVDLLGALADDPGVTPYEREACRDTVSLIALGERGLQLLRRAAEAPGLRHRVEDVTLLAPISPRLILCSGENYWDHREEKPVVEGKEPEFFLKNPLGVISTGDTIQLDPLVTRKLDYEAELLIVIGRPGRHIPEEEALDHVFGFTIMNDVTARDRQVKLRPDGTSAYSLGPGKSFDTCAPIGPCIVTRDEIGDPQALAIRTFVNRELRQDNNTGKMIWTVAQLVAFFSTYITLQPGVVISTGTPGGTGWGSDAELGARANGRKLEGSVSRYLSPGDEVVCEIERIGELRNRVAAVPAARAPEATPAY